MASVRVAIGQICSSDDRGANLLSACAVVEDAARAGADLVVLPEYASAFDPRGVGIEHAEALDGPFVTGIRAAAERHEIAVIAGTTIPGVDPRLAQNVIVAVAADGAVMGTYRKVHLYDAFGVRESDRLEPGPADAAALVVQVGEGRFGVLTCYDLRFPESARRLADGGANVIVVPAAWAQGAGKVDQWRVLARARAIENTAFVVAVGMAGKGVIGHSLITGPDGTVGLECDDATQTRVVDLDLDAVEVVREVNPSLANRKYAVVPR